MAAQLGWYPPLQQLLHRRQAVEPALGLLAITPMQQQFWGPLGVLHGFATGPHHRRVQFPYWQVGRIDQGRPQLLLLAGGQAQPNLMALPAAGLGNSREGLTAIADGEGIASLPLQGFAWSKHEADQYLGCWLLVEQSSQPHQVIWQAGVHHPGRHRLVRWAGVHGQLIRQAAGQVQAAAGVAPVAWIQVAAVVNQGADPRQCQFSCCPVGPGLHLPAGPLEHSLQMVVYVPMVAHRTTPGGVHNHQPWAWFVYHLNILPKSILQPAA